MRTKRAGRPTTTANEGQKSMLGVRVTPDLKARIQAASERNGNSLSAEMEERLTLSFRDEDLLLEALDRIYGKFLANVLRMVGEAMRNAGERAAMMRGFLSGKLDIEKTDVFTIGRAMGEQWPNDPVAYAQVLGAALAIFDMLRPPDDGEADAPTATGIDDDVADFKDLLRTAGEESARDVLMAILDPAAKDGHDRAFGEDLRRRLNPDLLARIEARLPKGKGSED
jgi:hypothetical protein